MSVSWCCVGCLSSAFWQPCNDIHALRWIFLVHLVCWFTKNCVSPRRCAARRDNMCLLSPSEKISWRASLGSFHRNEFLRKVVIRYRIQFFLNNTKCNWNCFASDVLASPILPRIVHFFSEEFRSIIQNLGNKEWFFSRHESWTSRFNMMTMNEILSELLRRPKNPYWFLRHLLLLQVETLPYRHDILRWDLVRSAFKLSRSQIHVVKEWCWFSGINQLHRFLPHGNHILLPFHHVDAFTKTDTNSPCFRWTNGQTLPVRYFYPSWSQIELLQWSLSQ